MDNKRMNDIEYMQRCLQLAELGRYYVAPNPMVGAVLVDGEGHIVAEGWHRQYGGPHAEPNCLNAYDARRKDEHESLKDHTLYVSLEPCSHWGKTPPCADLIVRRGIGRVVIGCPDPNPRVAGRGIQILRDAGIEVTVGVCEQECRELNRRFLCLQEQQRPYVILKWAQTADGYIDRIREVGSNEQPLVISTPLMKQVVHKMRAENMAIMVGTRTVLLDNPRLKTTRWVGRNPIRISIDRHGVIPSDSRIFEHEPNDEKRYAGQDEVIIYRDITDWHDILADLAQRNIHSILVEGGATLLSHILETGIWDEAQVEIAQTLFIGQGVKAPSINANEQIKTSISHYEKDHTIITYRH